MTRDQFITQVNTKLSVGCSLPFNLPKKALELIIDEATKWFYKNYEYAVEDMYMLISNSLFKTDQYKEERSICIDGGIMQIYGVDEIGSGQFSIFGHNSVDSDFSASKFIYQDVYYNNIYDNSLVYAVMQEYWLDLSRNIILHPITYQYNPLSKKLRILGQTPKKDIVLTVSKELPPQFLYEDEIFFRYVIAKAKIDLSRMMGTFEFQMPGNVRINFDLIRSEGQDELTEVKEEIDDDEGVDFFFVQQSN